MKLKIPFKTCRSSGFSLVEVILAVGIVATVMIGLVGVLPVGMASLQDSQRNSIQSRIVQEIITEAQSAVWATHKGKDPDDELRLEDVIGQDNIRYYDAQGTQVARSERGKDGRIAIYAALVLAEDNPRYFGDKKENQYKFLKKMTVAVEYTPGGREPDFQSEPRQKFIAKFPFVLANMGNSDAVRAE